MNGQSSRRLRSRVWEEREANELLVHVFRLSPKYYGQLALYYEFIFSQVE